MVGSCNGKAFQFSFFYQESFIGIFKAHFHTGSLDGIVLEYRAGEGSAKESLRAVQQTCDNMIREAEAKCLKMLHQAEAQAPSTSLADAKAVAREGIESLETQLKEVLDKLETIKSQAGAETHQEAPKPQNEAQVAQEIAQNLEKLVGTTEDTAPVPRSPRVDSNTTSRFTNLQFGKNYDPTKR